MVALHVSLCVKEAAMTRHNISIKMFSHMGLAVFSIFYLDLGPNNLILILMQYVCVSSNQKTS